MIAVNLVFPDDCLQIVIVELGLGIDPPNPPPEKETKVMNN